MSIEKELLETVQGMTTLASHVKHINKILIDTIKELKDAEQRITELEERLDLIEEKLRIT